MHRRGRAVLLVALLSAASSVTARTQSTDVLPRVDHLIYATRDLDRTVDSLAQLLGVRATPGGSSPGRGTRNALISLGPASYLEIVAPDPAQPAPTRPPWWMAGLEEPRIVQWAANGRDLEQLRAAALKHAVPLGEVVSGSRLRPDSVLLTWHMTSARTPVADGVVPIFIDWGTSWRSRMAHAQR
jgi:hypothetical protein